MSKADELLQRLIYQAEMFAITYNNKEELSEVDSLLSDITYYLDRKDKLVVGSEWVCDVECIALLYHQHDYFEKNDCVVIKNKEHSKIELTHTDEWYEGAIFWMPLEQFLACFSPKEKE